MDHNRVWLDKYNPIVHSQDHVKPCTTDRTPGILKPARDRTVPAKLNVRRSFHARMESTGAPRVSASEPYGICRYMYGILQPRDRRTCTQPIERPYACDHNIA